MNKLNFYGFKQNFRMKNEPMANNSIHICIVIFLMGGVGDMMKWSIVVKVTCPA